MNRRATRIHVGTRGWQYPDDVSGFYPDDLPEDWQLELYTTYFHLLEIPPVYEPLDPGTVAFYTEATLEDALLSIPLAGPWAQRLARGASLLPLAHALAPLQDKLGVLVWPQKPPLSAASFWPDAVHIDGSHAAHTNRAADPPGSGYWLLAGPGRYSPEELKAFAQHLLDRAERGRESFVVFANTDSGKAIMDAGNLQEAINRLMG